MHRVEDVNKSHKGDLQTLSLQKFVVTTSASRKEIKFKADV